jgi:hypothetical protein
MDSRYKIYAQAEFPAICLFSAYNRFTAFKQLCFPGKFSVGGLVTHGVTWPAKDGSAGQVTPNVKMSSPNFQHLLDFFVGMSKISTNRVTLHFGRRTGAQLRYIRSANPWSLRAMLYWGCWDSKVIFYTYFSIGYISEVLAERGG